MSFFKYLRGPWQRFMAVGLAVMVLWGVVHWLWTRPLLVEVERLKDIVQQRQRTAEKLRARLQRERTRLAELKRERSDLRSALGGWRPVGDTYQFLSTVKSKLKRVIASGDIALQNYRVVEGKDAVTVILTLSANIRGVERMLRSLESLPGSSVKALQIRKIRRPKGDLDLSVRVECEGLRD